MSLVTVSAAEYECPSSTTGDYLVQYSGSKKCFASLTAAINDVKEDETAEIIFLKNQNWNPAGLTIEKNVTLNLNGHTVTIAGGALTFKGATVTIKNGTIDGGNSKLVVDSSEKATTLTIADDVTVKGAATTNSVVLVKDATKKTTLNLNGTWTINNEIVNCAQKAEEVLTVNLNAKVTATGLTNDDGLVVLDAGNSVVNVNGGTYKANEYVFALTNGTLNINAGTMESTDEVAIVVKNPAPNLTNVLNITGGTITSKKNYAIWFAGSEGTHKIAGGTFTSGKDSNKKQLPALRIYNNEYLNNHKGMITKGTFTGSIVGEVENEDGRYVEAAAAAKILVGNATVSEKDGDVYYNKKEPIIRFKFYFNFRTQKVSM